MTGALRGRKIGVTGATGFLGSAVTKLLLEHGSEVSGFSADCSLGNSALAFPSTVGDVCDASAVAQFVRELDTLVHLAGPPSVAASFEDPARYIRIHAEGTARVVEASVRAGVERLIYISSAEVYGQPRSEFVAEDHPLQARSPYAAAKICAEKLIEIYGQRYGLQAVVLRPFSIYGPGASPHSVLSRIINAAAGDRAILLDDLRPVRDYCYVEDVAEAVLCACQPQAAKGVFNIGTMQPTSVRELAEIVLCVLGKSQPIQEREDKARRSRPAAADILRLVADNRMAARHLRWKPAKSLEQGLQLMLGAGLR